MAELDNLIQATFGGRRSNARIQAVNGIDTPPEDAARAIQLGQDSGQDPNAILGDLPTFERQHKQALTGNLIESDPHLQRYVDSNPMAAKVSSDDWGSLGKVAGKLKDYVGVAPVVGGARLPFNVTEALKGLGEGAKNLVASSLMGYGAMAPEIAARQLKALEEEPTTPGESPEERAAFTQRRSARRNKDVIEQRKEALRGTAETKVEDQSLFKAGKAFESFGKEALSAAPGWEDSWTREISSGAGSMLAGLGISAIPYAGPALAASVFLGSGMGEAAERAIKAGATEEQARKATELGTIAGAIDMTDMLLISLGSTGKALSAAKAIGTRAIYGAMTQGGQEGVQELIQNAIEQGLYNPDKALHENVAKSAAIGMIVGGIAAGGMTAANRQMDIRQEATRALSIAELYTRSGMEPPVGSHFILDTLKARQAEKEAEVFDDLMGEVFENQTRLRAPEIFKNLPDQFGDKNIFISGEAIVEAYGQNAPEPGDGKLGFVPGIAEQYQSSLLTGADIVIPLADYVAFADKNFHANVKEEIRYRDGGMTLKEAKAFDPVEMAQQVQPPQGEPLEGPQGAAIGAVRQAAHLKSLDEIMDDADAAGAQWAGIGGGQEVLHAEFENLPPEYQELVGAVDEWINRTIPHIGGHVPVFSIQEDSGKRRKSSGIYSAYKDMAPLIYWSFSSKDPYGTARHEAIHFLRRYNFLTEQEWNVLARAARDGKWITPEIMEAYSTLPMDQIIEEAVAERYAQWDRSEDTKASGPVEEIFKKLKEIAAGLKRVVESVFGLNVTPEQIFSRIESGEIGRRKPGKPNEAKAYNYAQQKEKQPELPGLTRQEDMQIAKGAAFGMTEAQYKKYEKLIKDQHLRDQEYIRRKAVEAETRRQTKEWKAKEKEVREEVLEDTNQTPVIAATNFFLNGQVPGAEKLRFKPKLAWNAITAEQRKALPKDIAAPGGLNPDDVAPLLGFPSGKEMITAMMAFEAAKGELNSRNYLNKLVDDETNRRMEERFGKLSENILAEAEEHVYGSLQMDILHEEIIALAVKADLEFTFSKQDIEDAVRSSFGQLRHMDIKSHRFTKEAGKAGKEVEAQLLKGDFKEAFVAKQKQFYSALMAKMAIKLEKDQKVFQKLAKRLGNDKIKSMDREWVDFGQKMLANANLPINRFPQFLQEAMERSGYTNLPDFVAGKLGEGMDGMAEVDPYLAQGQYTPYEQQTVDQFYSTKTSVQAMVDSGRAAGAQIVKGDRQDWQDLKDTFITNIKSLPVREPGQFKWRYAFDASLTKMEEIIKDLDLREEAGPLWKYMIQPMAEAKHTEYDMQEALVKKMTAIRKQFGRDWIKSLDETIPNNFLRDPNDGSLFDLTRQNMINIMLNFGTRSNIKKFVEGYTYPNHKTDAAKLETQLRNMFDQHATKEDWDFVQEIWDIFEGWRGPAEEMYYELGGQSKLWLPADEVMTKHGPVKGGYYPIIEDHSRPGSFSGRNKPVAPNAIFGPNYFRATTANNYTIERTGAIWPVDFNYPLEKLASRMQQMIHDISYRRAVMQANKVIEDKEIMFNIRRHYGPEYADQFKPWIADISNHFNMDEMAMSSFYGPMRKMRMNLIVHALGLNLGVIGSPDVGAFNPKAATEVLLNRGPDVALAWSKSREIPHTFKNMDRDFREATERNFRRLKLNDVQSTAARWAFWPVVKVSQGFRIITWVSQYKAALAEGMADGDAVALADSAVRTRHGSGGIPDLPAVMRSNEGWKAITMFYGYFNTMYNWQRQIPAELRKGNMMNAMTAFYGTTLIGAAFGALLFNRPKKDESWFQTMARAVGGQFAGYVPFAREGYGYWVEGQLPNTPYASLLRVVGQGAKDVVNVAKGKKVEKPIQHVANTLGMGFGLPLAQIGRTGQFLSDVALNKQRPKNFWDWWWGIRFGESKPKR